MMSINLSQILPQLSQFSDAIAERRRKHQEMLPLAQAGLRQAAQLEQESLSQKIRAAGDRWPGAAPTDERLEAIFPAPVAPETVAVIGSDGSQIYPDRHASAFYFLLNIGSITVQHGSQTTPTVEQRSALFFDDDNLYDAQGRPIQPAMINLRRDVAEMQALANQAGAIEQQPTVALLDNSLLLWMTLEADVSAQREIDQHLARYLDAMDQLRKNKTALAGFIDRPRNANTLALIHLAQLPESQITKERLQINPYRGLSDLDLFKSLLPVGSRSARFTYTSPLNRDFEAAGHQVQYFYLNPGPLDRIVRVEIPAWVGAETHLLDLLHSAILMECKTTGGFPYVLIRAHELAVVSAQEREVLDQHIEGKLLQIGHYQGASQKSVTKGWTQSRRRHRL
jgi:hypothetical protein